MLNQYTISLTEKLPNQGVVTAQMYSFCMYYIEINAFFDEF